MADDDTPAANTRPEVATALVMLNGMVASGAWKMVHLGGYMRLWADTNETDWLSFTGKGDCHIWRENRYGGVVFDDIGPLTTARVAAIRDLPAPGTDGAPNKLVLPSHGARGTDR